MERLINDDGKTITCVPLKYDTEVHKINQDTPIYEEVIKTTQYDIVPDSKIGKGRTMKRIINPSFEPISPKRMARYTHSSVHYFSDPDDELTSSQPQPSHSKRRGRPSKSILNDTELLYECPHCAFKTENHNEFENHYTIHNLPTYPCPYCTTVCNQKGNLMTHLRTHTKERPFKCMLCNFSATQKVNLQNHVRTHTKEKPFKCNECDFAAAQRGNLMTHKARKHSSNLHVIKPKVIKKEPVSTPPPPTPKTYRCGNCSFKCYVASEIMDHVKDNHPLADLISCDFRNLMS